VQHQIAAQKMSRDNGFGGDGGVSGIGCGGGVCGDGGLMDGCIPYQRSKNRSTTSDFVAQIDFSKLSDYRTRASGSDVYFSFRGTQGLWCKGLKPDNYHPQGSGTCYARMGNSVFEGPRHNFSQLLRAIQFIRGVCPSQVPF
jgi:hypothetical protein